jgi:integrase
MEEILELARKTSTRDWAILCLALNHGMRVSELAGGSGDGEVKFPPLRLVDVDVKNRQITIRRLKGSLVTTQAFVDLRGKPHLSDSAALKAYLGERIDDGSGLLFTGQKGPLTRFTLNKMFHKYCEQVSVARVTRGLAPIPPTAFKFHSIKHTTAQTMIDNGADVYQVKAHLGHAAISSTERYLVPNQRIAHQYVQRAFGQAFSGGY